MYADPTDQQVVREWLLPLGPLPEEWTGLFDLVTAPPPAPPRACYDLAGALDAQARGVWPGDAFIDPRMEAAPHACYLPPSDGSLPCVRDDLRPCGGTDAAGLALGCTDCAFADGTAGQMFESLVPAPPLGGCFTLAGAHAADARGAWPTPHFFSAMMRLTPTACFTPPDSGGFRCYSDEYFGACD